MQVHYHNYIFLGHLHCKVSGVTTGFKCENESNKLSFWVYKTRLVPETTIIDTLLTIARFWRLMCLVSAILTKDILQQQKTRYVQQFYLKHRQQRRRALLMFEKAD